MAVSALILVSRSIIFFKVFKILYCLDLVDPFVGRSFAAALSQSRLSRDEPADEWVPPPVLVEPVLGRPDILLLVSSPALQKGHAERRMALRRTWAECGRPIGLNWTCGRVFFVGMSSDDNENAMIIAEAKIHRDILVVDTVEKYSGIHSKLLSAFLWVLRAQSRYILKTDDDVYVDVDRLSQILSSSLLPERLYAGKVYRGDVVRDPGHRHYVATHDYPLPWFPPFCVGSMYVFSGQFLPDLLRLSRLNRPFHVDDAFVGILFALMDVRATNLPSFYHSDSAASFISWLDTCDLYSFVGFSHSLSASSIYYIHDRVQAIKKTF